MDVPESERSAHVVSLSGRVTFALRMESPGATMSGLMRSSCVGPAELNAAKCSYISGSAVIGPEMPRVVPGSRVNKAESSSPSFFGRLMAGMECPVI